MVTLNRHLDVMETILEQITEMGLQLSFSPVLSGVHLPHAFSAACVTQDYIYKHLIPILAHIPSLKHGEGTTDHVLPEVISLY